MNKSPQTLGKASNSTWLHSARIAGAVLGLVACAMTSAVNPCFAQEKSSESFFVELRNGDSLEVTTADVKFDWLSIAMDGSSSVRKIQASEIAKLKFATQPASEQVAEVRGVISQLGDDSYEVRAAAEQRLSNEGAPFIQLLDEANDYRDAEVRYRIARILAYLKKEARSGKSVTTLEFDQIELVSGEKIDGDIGEFAFQCQWSKGQVSLDRVNCLRLGREPEVNLPKPTVVPMAAAGEIEMIALDDSSLFMDGEEVKEGFVRAGFETDSAGEPLTRSSADAREYPAHKGLLLESGNESGTAIIAGYKFKRSQSGARGFTNRFIENGKARPYRGISRLEFCVPGNSREPATISQLSLMLEITKPQHTVIEAYNTAGHIVGLVYCGADHTSTVGLQSNDQIAYVLVQPNPYFDPAPTKLNADFAVDDVHFNEPVWAPELNLVEAGDERRTLLTNDNKRLNVNSFRFNKENNTVEFKGSKGFEDFSTPMEDIAWLLGPQSYKRPERSEEGAFVMLQDGSVAFCEFKDGPQVVGSDLKLDPKEILGVWGRAVTARYPHTGDFKHGKMVMVRPLNRVGFAADMIDWKSGKLNLDLAGAKFIRQLIESDKPKPEGDVEAAQEEEPKETEGEIVDQRLIRDAVITDVLGGEATEATPISLMNAESIWFAPPNRRDSKSGLLRLLDGQQFVLGSGENSFKLVELSGDKITIEKQGSKLTFSVDAVSAFQSPK